MTEREYINRVNAQGEKTGVWKTFYPNGSVKEEEYYKNGVLEGKNIMYSEKGTTINERIYRDGKIIEDGIPLKAEIANLISYYEDGVTIKRKGTYLDSIPIGAHYFYNRDGKPEKRINYNRTGIRIGEGPVDENEKRVGNWKNYYETGELRSDGRFVNDRQHGEWNYYSINGKKEQIGNFNNGVIEGEWKWYYPSGNILREEIYERGKPNGLCVQYSDSLTIIAKGLYTDGEREGQWLENVGNIREEGTYVMGLKEGMWKAYQTDGQLYHEGVFVQGNPDGRHRFYYPDGTLKEEQYYVMGRRVKNWKKYNEDGNLFLTITYNNDQEIRINGVRIDNIKKTD
jgi:antitoxin component YwqK of YwqJK toxin-antitoxin module